MAKLNKMVLGHVSGTLGDVTFRQRKGLNYVAARPSKYTVPQDTNARERRARFALSGKLASIINSIPQLKSLWMLKIPAGSNVYNFLVKTNYKVIDPGGVNASTYLSPAFGFGVSVSASNITGTGIELTLTEIGTRAGINTVIEPSVQLISVLCMDSPVDESLDASFLLPLSSEIKPVSIDAPLAFSLPLSSQDTQVYNKYNVRKLLSALVTLDADVNPVHYSSTFLI